MKNEYQTVSKQLSPWLKAKNNFIKLISLESEEKFPLWLWRKKVYYTVNFQPFDKSIGMHVLFRTGEHIEL